eukprot:GHVU01186289.1.p1 GENE.GHVU01186289.1~~GHVU01186289.1.p1  ORF type:complete len:162 (+),score=38.09 GHVU01186289.1:903-1388(+)
MSTPPERQQSSDSSVVSFFHGLLNLVSGLQLVLLSDRHGATIRTFMPDGEDKLAAALGGGDDAVQQLVAVFAVCADQTAAIPALRSLNYVLSTMADSATVLQVNEGPLVLTFYSDPGANVGALLEMLPVIRRAVSGVRSAITDNPTSSSDDFIPYYNNNQQ